MRSPCSGLLVLWKAKTGGMATFWSWRQGRNSTAAIAGTNAFLAFRLPFCQELFLCITIGQSSDARVRLSFRSAFFHLNGTSWHAVALHQPGVPLVFCSDTGLGTGTQLICHSTLRLSTSFWVVVFTLVSISALLSWNKCTDLLFYYKQVANKHYAKQSICKHCKIFQTLQINCKHVNQSDLHLLNACFSRKGTRLTIPEEQQPWPRLQHSTMKVMRSPD